jgi:outer membrane lipoprotein
MKRTASILLLALAVAACAPMLSKEYMREGSRDVPMRKMAIEPDAYKGKLYILGGLIVNTRLVEQGSEVEALYVPVDSSAYLLEGSRMEGRFLALFPKANGYLDPMVFKKGREVSIAAEFTETRKGKIDEMEYLYPVFTIRQIYLWPQDRYYAPYYPPYPGYPPYWYDRWGRPYPGPYWPYW